MNLELESMAIQMPVVDQHPNREAFVECSRCWMCLPTNRRQARADIVWY